MFDDPTGVYPEAAGMVCGIVKFGALVAIGLAPNPALGLLEAAAKLFGIEPAVIPGIAPGGIEP